MGLFACFARPSVAADDTPGAKEVVASELLKKPSQPDLVKQDSAYVDRAAFKAAVAAPQLSAQPENVDDSFDNPISAAYSVSDSQTGAAAPLQKFGPPKPICNAQRLANIEELGVLKMKPGNPQIHNIMQLMCTVFETESALVALIGDDHIYIHDAINFMRGDFPWRQSFCAHTLTPQNHQVMVVEDPSKDARFKHLPMVKSGALKFYAGTPIVSSKGHRLGTVCFASGKSRKFTAEGCNMLINMCELVTRELEREWAEALQIKALDSKPQDMPQLLRAIECFNDAVLFVDVSQPGWRVLHMNAVAATKLKLFGVAVDTSREVGICDIFELDDSSDIDRRSSGGASSSSAAGWERHANKARAGRKFEVPVARLVDSADSAGSSSAFSMVFRSAANDVVDSNSPLVGTPANMPMGQVGKNYYFVTLTQRPLASQRTTNSSRLLGSGPADPTRSPFEGVELGPLLGRGGYGRVYRGMRDSQTLAVKVITNTASLKMVDGVPLEAAITRDAVHPNVLRTLDYALTDGVSDGGAAPERRYDSAESAAKARRAGGETWMLLEYCDMGCLQEASDKGFFRKDGQAQMPAILSVAHNVASGMAFLHARGVAHGDLTGGNVLLASAPGTPSGLTAKIADFGLARSLNLASKIETRTYGTVTHMPPELLEHGVFSKAADSFALGVLMWEMYHGVRAWSSMNHAQIITAVAVNRRSLRFGQDAPEGYAALAGRLMAHEPDARPTFEEAAAEIARLQGVAA